jgi:hypothetical protein
MGEIGQKKDIDPWSSICEWASMRSQTLFRTVAGMVLYHHALDCHFEVQKESATVLSSRWNAGELFTCMITMQRYPEFKADDLKHTNAMLEIFPSSFRIAFIDTTDFNEKDPNDPAYAHDGLHPKMKKRYYSCLIKKESKKIPNPDRDEASWKRTPYAKIELPGYPILGDGKGDNQNHAIPFSRGSIIQCIDANQGAYFEQMLLLPCVLGEFRNASADGKGKGLAKRIVGFPEHITSDFGSVGDFAAGAETAFGTTLQRSYAALGSRMHYGHPDMMNKTFIMQQGGVSKATKTVNLSEDIFAGMDFTLRGDGRNIKHAEYFHVVKGRDLGFATVLTFFMKLSSGTGEQVLTRQVFRLGHVLGLGEFLGFYYAHGGFYITQHLVARSVPLLVLVWSVVLLDDPEGDLARQVPGGEVRGAQVVGTMLAGTFSKLIILFMLAQIAPLFAEIWLQQGFFKALSRVLKQFLTLAPLHFIFQAKAIGIYVTNEIRYGGAAYLATGRGLPIDRSHFVTPEGRGLYGDWAELAFYDGFRLLVAVVIVGLGGGLTEITPDGQRQFRWALLFWFITLALTILSWLYAPFLFNPYQFEAKYFFQDFRELRMFFTQESTQEEHQGKLQWQVWHEKTQLKMPAKDKKGTVRPSLVDAVYWIAFVGIWYTVLNSKMYELGSILSFDGIPSQVSALLPPIFGSTVVIFVISGSGQCNVPISCRWVYGLIVAACDVAEAVFSLRQLLVIQWWKTFMAGLIFKYAALSLVLTCAELPFRLRSDPAPKCITQGLKTWLYAHRMAFDMIVSFFLLFSLSPIYIIDGFRSVCCGCCKRFSCHNLLVFRDPGHVVDGANVLTAEGERETSFAGRIP